MPDLKSLCGEKLHTRKIAINTYEAPDKSIVVEGILKDDRLRETHTMTGQIRPPDRVHHMIVRLRVEGPPLTITAVEVEMPVAPMAECQKTLQMLAPVTGMQLTAGFTAAVKTKIGGPKGCAHLTALILAMAPAAVQGFWSMTATRPIDPVASQGLMLQFLADTCYVWRSDGEQITALKNDR
ncbi:MAG: DUF2889 domain-containing protein [Pseudomonadota bacterium]